MSETIQYIIRFMIGDFVPEEISRFVGYTSDVDSYADYKVVIKKSVFFDEGMYGTGRTNPSLPLKQLEGIPVLYGKPDIERVGDTIVIHADLVASAFFMLGRYEEMINREVRDAYGRFAGCQSLPYRAGFIERPIVDEYGKLIRKLLHQSGVKIDEPAPSIRKIYLTHDVDEPFSCRTWRNIARNIVSGRNPLRAIRDKYQPLQRDSYYTFPWLLQQNKLLRQSVGEDRCQTLLFFKAGGITKNDKPRYNINGKDIQALFDLCRQQEAIIGLHSSYHAGMEPLLIPTERKKLEAATGTAIKHNRHHFLSSREPEDMELLEKAGITDDFTMGYADVAGFRLGTSFPVRHINCVTRRLFSLILHPLVIMDGTLSDPQYMKLPVGEATENCKRLIQNIRNVNGELTLLWHNINVIEGKGYHRELYQRLINELNKS